MRRVIMALGLAVIVTAIPGALSVDPALARIHAEAVRATYPRPEASEGERVLLDYILSVAARNGLETVVRDFSGSSFSHSFSRVVEVVVPGSGQSTIVLVAPVNHPEGASPDEDRSASVAAALTIMEAAATQAMRPTIRFLFPGAEYGSDPAYPKGTRLFLDNYFAEEPHALLYLDVSRMPVVLETGGGGTVAPSWLLEGAVNAAVAGDTNPTVLAGLNQLHRLGISNAPGALVSYLDAGIPSLYLRSGPQGLEPPDVARVATQLASVLGDWTEQFSAGIPQRWDRHYLYFRLGRRQIVIGEQVFLGLLLALLATSMLYALVFRRRFTRYLRTIARNLWNLPALFLLIFAFLSAATYTLELFVLVRSFPTIWQYYPGAYFAFKITLAVFLFTIAAQFLRHLPLSKNGSFYSAAALFVLFVDIILFSILNLSFGYYFIWAFFWAFVFSVVRARALKALSLFIAPYFFFLVAVEVLRVPELRLTAELLLSSRGDLLLSFMTLPFLLMLIRLDFLIRHPVRGRRSFALGSASIVLGVMVTGMVVFVLASNPFTQSNPQPVVAVETVDYTDFERTLEISSPARIAEARVLFAGEEYVLEAGSRDHELTSLRLPDVLSVRLSYEDFLDRDRGRLEIDAPLPIESLSVRLESDEPMVLYDVGFPFAIAADRRSAEVFIGRRPPLPLIVDFTVGRNTAPSIEIVAQGTNHPDPLEIVGPGIETSTRLLVRTRLGR